MMTPQHLRKIGESSSFHELLIAVAKETNKFLRPALERALKACSEGENESPKAKKERKKQIEAGIAKANKKNARTAAKKQAQVTEYIRREWCGGLPAATEGVCDDDDEEVDAATNTGEATSTTAGIDQDEQGEIGHSEMGHREETSGEAEETKQDFKRESSAHAEDLNI